MASRKVALKGIPKVIYQTWKSKELAQKIVSPVESWKSNTDYKYSYSDDDDCSKFIDSLGNKDLKACYNKLPIPVMKADLWRYLVIYQNGGVYSDVDTVCNKPVNTWIPSDAKLVLCIEDNRELFCQWTFAAQKNHPALKQVIGDVLLACRGYIDTNNPHFVHGTTGPAIWTKSMLKYMSNALGKNLVSSYEALSHHDDLAKLGIYVYDEHFFKTNVVSHLYASQWSNVKGYTSWHSDRAKIEANKTEKAFTSVYSSSSWGNNNGVPSSGPGSTIDYCRSLGDFLCSYLSSLPNIKKLCDLGCGDMAWIGELVVDKLGIKYVGVDCVAGLISTHTNSFINRSNYAFWHMEFSETSTFPEADVYFIKDVLQHWESDVIYEWLSSFFKSNPDAKLIVVNCNYQSGKRNLNVGGFYPLNSDHYPLMEFACEHLMSWDSKTVYMVKAKQEGPSK